MLRLTRVSFAAVFAAVVVPAAAMAQDTSTAAAAQRQEALGVLARVEFAFANADAKGLASCWTPTGEFIGPGGASAEGREAIEKLFQEAFASHKQAKLTLSVQRFRLVNDSLALVDAVAEVKPAVATGGTPLASFVLVKRDGRWLIESAREVTAHMPQQTNHLKDLGWMVGEWASATTPAGISMHTSCDWTANQAFLIRKFKVEGKDVMLRGGTEVIGWDPRGESFRSWAFDSDGGFGESLWVRDGNRWMIKFSGTLADGSMLSATHILSKVDDNTITVQSKDRTINGAAQPDVPETMLKRQAAAATAPKVGATSPSATR
jgi:uncharacterized protein (TIGR02246 family)